MAYIDLLFPLALAFAAAALLFAYRASARRYRIMVLSLAPLLLISSIPLASFFAKPLEARYDGKSFVDTGEAIVVLAGGCSPADQYRPYTTLAADSYGRSLSAAWLYRAKPGRPVVVTGMRCAAGMARLLETEGVAQSMILQEGQATNTHENALYAANLLRSRGISKVVLVTDAKSMLRAELCFRKEGLEIVPYPVGLGSFRFSLLDVLPSWQAIKGNSDTLHEVVGLLVYRWAGWI